ncbi:uncharacterized protein B0H64DRAFT_394573 [Chaetomium fimeti]|uniref:Uncharacterized protein n=1 Tax=Chaetomium fimeti TaxID=1854472 RepID=A0AAE0HF23_9PEZI|nr:hypothetical protein B0H64DRAFT_394573 [Chaetomium fimeti]
MVSLRSLIAGVALIAAPVMAAMEPADIKLTFNILEASAESLEEVAHRINPVNALSQLIRQGPLQDLLEGFAEMTSTTNDADAELEGSSPIPDGEEADDVFYALRDFVRRHQVLSNILMGKASELQETPSAGPPMVDAVGKLKLAYEAFGNHTAALVDERNNDWQSLSDELSETFKYLIQEYEKLTDPTA